MQHNEAKAGSLRIDALDVLATALMDAFALAGIVSVIPCVKDDVVGAIAAMLLFAALGLAYTVAVVGEYRKNRGPDRTE